MRVEFLPFFKFGEIVKMSLLCREMYRHLDPNRIHIKTYDHDLKLTYKNMDAEKPQLNLYLTQIMQI